MFIKKDFVVHNVFTLLLKKRVVLCYKVGIICSSKKKKKKKVGITISIFPFLPSIFCFQGRNGADKLLFWFDLIFLLRDWGEGDKDSLRYRYAFILRVSLGAR